MPQFGTITPAQAMRLIGTPDAPAILDVRLPEVPDTAAPDCIALVIRGADTDRHHLAPQAAGLLALSVGLSRMFRDDLQQLETGIVLHDALYRRACDGHDTRHEWPAGCPAGCPE